MHCREFVGHNNAPSPARRGLLPCRRLQGFIRHAASPALAKNSSSIDKLHAQLIVCMDAQVARLLINATGSLKVLRLTFVISPPPSTISLHHSPLIFAALFSTAQVLLRLYFSDRFSRVKCENSFFSLFQCLFRRCFPDGLFSVSSFHRVGLQYRCWHICHLFW